MITCDIFELNVTAEGRTLRWSISTDLPGGTCVSVSVSRSFVNTRGNECVWLLWDGAILLTGTGPGDRNGAAGELNIDEGDAHGLKSFNELLGPYSAGTTRLV